MHRFIFALVIGITLASNAKLQTADPDTFESVFKEFAERSEFGKHLFIQLQEKVKLGAPLSDLDDHIAELEKHLEADQEADNKVFQEQMEKLNGEVSGVEEQVTKVKEQAEFLKNKIDVLTHQAEVIDALFEQDQAAYLERISAQNSMLETIDILVQKINEHLLEGHSLIETDDLFSELKKIGRGQHIEVLAQLTAHLDNEQVTKILELFNDLKTAINESLAADEAKEQDNIKLHSALREELGVLIPKTVKEYEEIETAFDGQSRDFGVSKQEILDLAKTFQDRSDDRDEALHNIKEAQELLNQNLDRLARWAQE